MSAPLVITTTALLTTSHGDASITTHVIAIPRTRCETRLPIKKLLGGCEGNGIRVVASRRLVQAAVLHELVRGPGANRMRE
jgi:hypothetical protein